MWSRLLRIISDKEKNSSSDASIFSSKRKITIIILSSVLPVIISLALIIIIVALPLLFVKQYMKDALAESPILYEKINNILVLNGWCTDNDQNCNKEGTQKYYDKLDEIYNKYKNNGVEIDVELITATIFYSNTQRPDLFQEPEEETSEITEGKIKLGDIDKLASNMLSGRSIDYTKYRNYLIDTYIPKRFKELYEGQVDEKETIEQIADEIMMFKSLEEGKSQTGGACVTYSCNTIYLTGDYAGEYSIEDYVKGVVNAESGRFKNDARNYQEEWKAQAIAARSMVLKQFDICNESVPNTTNFQKFKPDWSQELSDAVDETAGMVLTDNNDIFLAQYDAFFEGNGSNYHCDGDLCYSTYYKKGSGTDPSAWEKHEINTYSKYASSFAPYPNGHGIGMSQWGSAYLADIGKNYEEILGFYYADNIKISKIGNSCSVDTTGYDWRQADPRWGNKSYGGATLGGVGCNFTSIVIQIARSGKPTTISDFNPGTAFDIMKAHGQFGYYGDTLNYSNFTLLAPDFKFSGTSYTSGYTHDQIREVIKNLLDNNKYPILHVMSGNDGLPYATWNHWVAAVGYTDNDIEIVDPADVACTRLFTCQPGLDIINGYETVDQIHYWE